MRGSPLPALAVQSLKKAGAFANGSQATATASWVLKAPGIFGVFQVYLKQRTVMASLEVDCQQSEYFLKFITRKAGYGDRLFWECPSCGQVTDLLLYVQQNFLCRKCFKRYSMLKHTHAKSLIFEALQAIAAGDCQIKRFDERAEVQVGKQAKSKERPASHARENDPVQYGQIDPDLGTERALNNGQGMVDWAIFDTYCALNGDELSSLPAANGYVRPAKISMVGSVPELDIRVIYNKLEPPAGVITAWLASWGEHRFQRYRIVFIDRRGASASLVLADSVDGTSRDRWQRVQIYTEPGGRNRFICPVAGVCCDILYERGGVFASRQAQRMIHPSQRGAKRKPTRKTD